MRQSRTLVSRLLGFFLPLHDNRRLRRQRWFVQARRQKLDMMGEETRYWYGKMET
jgi:hypothetical protein